MNVNAVLVKKLQSPAQSWKGTAVMSRALIICIREGWVSSKALSRSAVSKSRPESVCVLITPESRLNLLHLLQCAINIHMPEPTHRAGLIACLKMSPRCSRQNGKAGETKENNQGSVSDYLRDLWNTSFSLWNCLFLLSCENVKW